MGSGSCIVHIEYIYHPGPVFGVDWPWINRIAGCSIFWILNTWILLETANYIHGHN